MSLGGTHSLDGYTDAIGINWRNFRMSKSIEQQAAELLAKAVWFQGTNDMARALSRAGLLVSGRDVLCREAAAACVEANKTAPGECITNPPALARWYRCCEVGQKLAAYDREHAPKPRYYVEAFTGGHPDTHRVIDRSRNGHGSVRGFGTEAECIAIMNALAEKEASRV